MNTLDTSAPSLALPPPLGAWESVDDLYRFQDARLPAALDLARRSPFNRPRLAGAGRWETAADLDSVPLTTKQDLREQYPWGMLAIARRGLATYHESSGTSGEPTPSFFSERDWHDVTDRFSRHAVGLNCDDTVLVRTPYAMLTTAHQAHQAARSRGATVVPADNRSLVMPYARVVRALHDLDVTVAWCLPSEALLWVAAAREAGYRPERDFPALRAFLVAGEPLSEARRARISELWGGVPVHQDYGSTETGSLAGECAYGRLHLWADRFLAQVYDPESGGTAREGRGRLTITTLYREAMPLVRYDLEDTVEISSAACPCGWQLPTVRVAGRSGDGYPVAGRRVTPHELEEHVFRLPAEHGVLFWRARVRPDAIEAEIETAEGRGAPAAAALTRSLRHGLGVPARIRSLPPGGLVSRDLLRRGHEFVKPRTVFGADEDWDRAVHYY
ncbi:MULTISPECIES: AMP-binding protein [unclassified Streptomyces]|uniref:phenylacetate--CoA ligase family protein n=1 Tax=unclassified Streptomyces TaxID=2593676 RepID=UPI002DD85807|nr:MULTISPECIES: AMP-binding protein [unclassified Streptomyces]WSA91208.1 AMP-binding protein [Streptomyces sp. NBC_01795]WSB75533.1 AMP-binding protein [Streptomyces sp. NBC_01775]WSS45002.1 AMP-binding protein [Streptomyces sp. NBC_01187]